MMGFPRMKNGDLDDDDDDGEFDALDLTDKEAVYSVSRMVDLLETGDELDQEFILSEVEQLLGHCADDFQELLLPVLCRICPQWLPDLQFKAAKALSYVVACPILPESGRLVMNTCLNILQSGTELTGDDRIFYYQIWSGILVESMQTKGLQVVDSELVALLNIASINAKSRLMECRKAATRIYGAVTAFLDTNRINHSVLPDMLNLFDDGDIVVLGASIEAMIAIANALSPEAVDKNIWPRLMNLTDSEDVRIRCASLRTIAAILTNIRECAPTQPLRASFRNTTAALLKREIRTMKLNVLDDLRIISDEKYMVLETQADVFGELLYNTCDVLDQAQLKDAYKAYVLLASCNGPLLRRNVAFNFPGFALAMSDKFGDLTMLMELLSRDKDDEVRWNLAAGLHESVKILLPGEKAERLGKIVLSLLTDTHAAVTLNVLENFRETVEVFERGGCADIVRMLATGLCELQDELDGSWRLQKLMAEQIRDAMPFFGEETIVAVILPLLWRSIQNGTPPVRAMAAKATMHCFRHIADSNLFTASVQKYYVGISSKTLSHRLRIVQIDAALEGIVVFSSVLFRELFAKAVLKLAHDPVSNVRVKLAMKAHRFAPMCAEMPEFRSALTALRGDTDVDVREYMLAFKEKARLETSMFTYETSVLVDTRKMENELQSFSKRSEIKEILLKNIMKNGQIDDGSSDSQHSSTNRERLLESERSAQRSSFGRKVSVSSMVIDKEVVIEDDNSSNSNSSSGGGGNGLKRVLRRSRSFNRLVSQHPNERTHILEKSKLGDSEVKFSGSSHGGDAQKQFGLLRLISRKKEG